MSPTLYSTTGDDSTDFTERNAKMSEVKMKWTLSRYRAKGRPQSQREK